MLNTYSPGQTAAENGTRLYHASGRPAPQCARRAPRAARGPPAHAAGETSVHTKAAWPTSMGSAPGRPRSTGVPRRGSISASAGTAAAGSATAFPSLSSVFGSNPKAPVQLFGGGGGGGGGGEDGEPEEFVPSAEHAPVVQLPEAGRCR